MGFSVADLVGACQSDLPSKEAAENCDPALPTLTRFATDCFFGVTL